MHAFIYVTCPEVADLQRQKVRVWLSRLKWEWGALVSGLPSLSGETAAF